MPAWRVPPALLFVRSRPRLQNWIEEMTGCNLNEGTFADSLKNGIILCKCVRGLSRRAAAARARPTRT